MERRTSSPQKGKKMNDPIEVKIRAVEAATQDVFVDVNDLIIDLMMAAEESNNEVERRAYKKIIQKLTDVRNKAHAARQQKQKQDN